ncbi:MAG: hypothetical protein IJS15_09095, partial [Victivallales bacterium]|nr:hypothetical protein [Victivallales bacterium]
MKQRLLDALKHCKADYADIRFETSEGSGFTFRGKEQEGASVVFAQSGIVRACINGGWGIVPFDMPDDLEEKLDTACKFARLIGKEKTMIADGPVCTEDFKAEMKDDFRGHSIDEKVKVIENYNKILLESSEEISSTRVRYIDRFRTVHFASTRGACFSEERP